MIFTDVIAAAGNEFSSDLLGSQIFDYYRVMVDLSGNAMYLEEIECKPIMQSSIESFGFGFDFRDEKVVIDYVYEQSTANKKGVEPGQLVLKINGQSCEFSNYCDFIENFDIPVTGQIELELLIDNKPYLISLPKEKIL